MSIVIDRVSKSYDHQHVVNDISTRIETGELFVLLGASGSGKSTLLRLIAGLIQPDSGRVYLNDRDVTLLPPQARGTGFVFQNYSLFRHMTVAQNIAFGLTIRGKNQAERSRRVAELLDLTELSDYGDRLPAQLSGGQQQRVALARALAYEPSVLLLDEPFGALDVKIRAQLRQNFRAIQQRLGVTAILVTHDQEEAFDIADRIGIIEKGELLEVGTPYDLYQYPRTAFTATFLGTANLFAARRNGSGIYVGDAHLPLPTQGDFPTTGALQLLSRPEEIRLFTSRTAAEEPIIGRGIVEAVNFAGGTVRVAVMLKVKDGSEDPIYVHLTAVEARKQPVSVGQEVWLGLNQYHLLSV